MMKFGRLTGGDGGSNGEYDVWEVYGQRWRRWHPRWRRRADAGDGAHLTANTVQHILMAYVNVSKLSTYST